MFAELANEAVLANGLYYGELDNDQAKVGKRMSFTIFKIWPFEQIRIESTIAFQNVFFYFREGHNIFVPGHENSYNWYFCGRSYDSRKSI